MVMVQDVKHWNVLDFIGLCRSLLFLPYIVGCILFSCSYE